MGAGQQGRRPKEWDATISASKASVRLTMHTALPRQARSNAVPRIGSSQCRGRLVRRGPRSSPLAPAILECQGSPKDSFAYDPEKCLDIPVVG